MTFQVRLAPSGHQFTTSSDESILEAALRHGYALPYGCRNGCCGACKGKLLDGAVDYGTNPPAALTPADLQNNVVLCCQARATQDLVLEIKEIASTAEQATKVMPCKVVHKQKLSHDVVLLQLKPPASERMQFLAGQYIDILLKDGRKRSFSIANPPHEDDLIELHIRHVEGGDFTGYIFDQLQEKDVLRIEGPHGNFYLHEDCSRPIIFMAGGTGFAPIKAIIEHAFAEGLSQAMYLYWGVRATEDLYLLPLVEQWLKQHDNFHFIPVLSAPGTNDDSRSGYVHEAVIADFGSSLVDYQVYAGGPPAMVKAGYEAFLAQGLDQAHYHSDPFEFQSPKASKS